MATSTDGHLLKTVSTPLNRLITEGYVPDENNQWDLVNIGFLLGKLSVLQGGVDADLLALFTMLSDAMGVKMVFQNVPLTGLSTLPDLPTYQLKNKERVLLIAQIDSTQNGFYEWQTSGVPPSGTLVRLYDWRDIIAGNGLAINANNIAIKLLEYLALPLPPFPQIPLRNDNFLQFDSQGKMFARIAKNAVGLKLNEDRELYIDGAELGGGGGGASSLDIPHPDIDSVTGATVLLVGASGTINANGGNFRRDATVICDGFTVTNYVNRGWNINSAVIQATNLIGIHDVVVKHLTLDSGDTGKQKFTVLGAAVIDTVSPKAKRGVTTYIVVTGEGFALLSAFAANYAGISILLVGVTNRFEVLISVTVANGVNSGLYNLLCTNSFNGISFDSGTSGNNKLQVFGDPLITTVFRSIGGLAEVLLGETMEITCNGFDLTNDFTITPNSILTNGITLNSVLGLSTKKFINVTGSNNIADIGVYNLACQDLVNGGNSGTTGDEKVALNYATNANIRRAATWRAYGGGVLSDWSFVGNSIEKVGGSGDCYLEMDDIFLNPSYLNNLFGFGGDDFMTFFIKSLNGSLVGDVYIMLGNKGTNLTIADFNSTANISVAFKVSFDGAGGFSINYRSGQLTGYTQGQQIDYRFRLRDVGFNYVFTIFETASAQAMPNSTLAFGVNGHVPKTLHICMTNNFMVNDVYLQGRVGE